MCMVNVRLLTTDVVIVVRKINITESIKIRKGKCNG